jgi:hypothetical protein
MQDCVAKKMAICCNVGRMYGSFQISILLVVKIYPCLGIITPFNLDKALVRAQACFLPLENAKVAKFRIEFHSRLNIFIIQKW